MNQANKEDAIQKFHKARQQAALQEMMARFTGQSTQLLSFDEINNQLESTGMRNKGVQQIPLDAIVGSCGRYNDFSRTFLPLRESDKERWAGVRAYVQQKGPANIPPIHVYQLGEVYFVSDGNHRVSILRQMNESHIKADVVALESKLQISSEMEPDALILEIEYANFLSRSKLDDSRPEANLRLTVPGKYWILEAQIEAHSFMVAASAGQPIPFEEAAVQWYDGVYSGVVQIIQDRDLLQGFPDRTDADMYVWAFEHRANLKKVLAWEMGIGTTLQDLSKQKNREEKGIQGVLHRAKEKMTPKKLAKNRLQTGRWRSAKKNSPKNSRLFYNNLVAITDDDQGWQALEQALIVAKQEVGRLRGLHIVASEAERSSTTALNIRLMFEKRCQAAGVQGTLSIEAGDPVDKICERSTLGDLVVAPLLNPPGSRLLGRLSSAFRELIRRSARPVLAVPGAASPLQRPLLAYDGSPRAKEAMFVASYLAHQWQIPLTVLTVSEGANTAPTVQQEALDYLGEQGLKPELVQKTGPTTEAILAAIAEYKTDLTIVGGYSRSVVKDLVLGDTVDALLNQSDQPILICR